MDVYIRAKTHQLTNIQQLSSSAFWYTSADPQLADFNRVFSFLVWPVYVLRKVVMAFYAVYHQGLDCFIFRIRNE